MQIIHQKTGLLFGSNVVEANSFWRRLTGYMFYKIPPKEFDGIYFPQCQQVHNSFVRFPLDVLFIDRDNTVVKVIRNFRPWQLSGIYFNAASAIEFPAGVVSDSVELGDQITVKR
jgi:uncharacterized membrane protein (UPF0127 family)